MESEYDDTETTDAAQLTPVGGVQCLLSAGSANLDSLTRSMCHVLADAGCPLAPVVHERLRFETLVTELSATFVNVSASQVDSQIQSGLQRIVEFLRIDQGGLAEVLVEPKQLVITHSYHRTGAAHVRVVMDEALPWYTSTVYQGQIVRFRALPDDLPSNAVQEREQCTRVGLKAQVMIPLKVMDAVVGAIAFGSFRGHRDWPDDLIERLRLVGGIFSSALARKRADEALRAREHSLQHAREGLRSLAAKLLHAQEEERCRIAREMHDDWTQRLAMLGIDAAKLERLLGAPEKALPLLRTMREQLVSLSEDVHDLSRQLHPSILDVWAWSKRCGPSAPLSLSVKRSSSITARELYRPTCPKTPPCASTAWPRRLCGTSPSTRRRAKPGYRSIPPARNSC
jgi:signal transduction histidine kinase